MRQRNNKHCNRFYNNGVKLARDLKLEIQIYHNRQVFSVWTQEARHISFKPQAKTGLASL